MSDVVPTSYPVLAEDRVAERQEHQFFPALPICGHKPVEQRNRRGRYGHRVRTD